MARTETHPITGRALRAARSFAGLTQSELAGMALYGTDAISRLEAFGPNPIIAVPRQLWMLQQALQAQGVYISPDGRSVHLVGPHIAGGHA